MAQPRKLHDRFFKQAKEEGYAARSAYKLKQIQDKRSILKRNDRVIDLGCSPGSWMQVAGEIVGPNGCVGGIDLKPVEIDLPPQARTMVADIFKTDAAMLIGLATPQGKPPRLVDVLLSDMAPNTEGGAGGIGDHFRSIELCRRVLELAPALLRPSGNLVMKVFEGEAYPELLKDTQKMFADVKGFKPEASRDVSREMFIVAKGLKAGIDATPTQRPPGLAGPPPVPREGWGR
jgi:23S rRNA (uridine2552-2'-O)-methyltransferase